MEIVGDRMGAFSHEYRVNYSDGDLSKAVNELVDEIMTIGNESAQKIYFKNNQKCTQCDVYFCCYNRRRKKNFRCYA